MDLPAAELHPRHPVRKNMGIFSSFMESMQCWVVAKQNKGAAELQELPWCRSWVLAAGILLGQTLPWPGDTRVRVLCPLSVSSPSWCPSLSLTVLLCPADPGPAAPPAEGVTPPPAGAPPASAAP